MPSGSPLTEGMELAMSMVMRPLPSGALVMCRSPKESGRTG